MKSEKKCNQVISIRVSDELLKALKTVADIHHWSLSKTVKKILTSVVGGIK